MNMAQKAQNKKQSTAKATEAANDTGNQEEAVIVDSHVEAIQRLLKSGKERLLQLHLSKINLKYVLEPSCQLQLFHI